MIVSISILICATSFASTNSVYFEKVADAIYKAEGSTKYPYGIKQKYTNTTPRQACINTISNTYTIWEKAGKTNEFITMLGNRYAPTSGRGITSRDATLNSNWIHNVKFFLKKIDSKTK